MSTILDYDCLARQKIKFIDIRRVPFHRHQIHPYNSIISKVIAIYLFEPISVAAISDNIMQITDSPQVATPANGGSDIYTIPNQYKSINKAFRTANSLIP